MNVLHIQSSPRGDKSNSIALTKAFLSASRKILPTIDEDVLNVWEENLPEFDAVSIGAKYKAIKHEPMTDAESHTWNRIQELIGRFQRANRIVLGLANVELLHPIQAEAVDRSDRSAQLPVHV
jgi:FMN-dependent NADH-azoreductase